MLMMLTPVVLGILIIILLGLRFVEKYCEFEKGFLYMTWFCLLLVVGTAVYLSYATPTYAQLPFFRDFTTRYIVQQSNLLQE